MLDLPYVVAPAKRKTRRIGSKATGILELPIYQSLLVGESSDFSDLCGEGTRPMVTASKLAQRISGEQEISLLEAYTLVEAAATGRPLSEEQLQLKVLYYGEITEVAKALIADGNRRIQAGVTALIRHRLDRPAWSLDDTAKLEKVQLDALWSFWLEESEGGEPVDATPPSEEEIKKPQPGTAEITA